LGKSPVGLGPKADEEPKAPDPKALLVGSLGDAVPLPKLELPKAGWAGAPKADEPKPELPKAGLLSAAGVVAFDDDGPKPNDVVLPPKVVGSLLVLAEKGELPKAGGL